MLLCQGAFAAVVADNKAPKPNINAIVKSNAPLIDLRCEFRVNPLGIDAARPRLSWVMTSSDRGARQTAYQVIVDGVWGSGKVESDQSSNAEYGGPALISVMR
jgi:alpha-L-rhamnosidase